MQLQDNAKVHVQVNFIHSQKNAMPASVKLLGSFYVISNADIDECQEGANDCFGEGQTCVNTAGSYTCQCSPGLQFDRLLRECQG